MTSSDQFLANIDSENERKHLLKVAISTTILATLALLLAKKIVVASIMSVFAFSAWTGFLFFDRVGRDVYLLLSFLALTIGKAVSFVVLQVLYVLGIACFGLIGKVFGMDKLRKNFAACQKRATMYEDCPETTVDTFRRQS